VNFYSFAIVMIQQAPNWIHPFILCEEGRQIAHTNALLWGQNCLSTVRPARCWKVGFAPMTPCCQNGLIVGPRTAWDYCGNGRSGKESRAEIDCVLKTVQGLINETQIKERFAKIVLRLCVAGGQRNCMPEADNGLRVVALGLVRTRLSVPSGLEAAIQVKGLLIGGNCFVEFPIAVEFASLVVSL
jgi:hypothetical protein